MRNERRGHPRTEVSHPVRYLTNISPRARLATTVDISIAGAKIKTPHPLQDGQVVELLIAIYPKVINCRGTVVHTRWSGGEKPIAGIRFEEMSRQDGRYLKEHITYLMERRNKGVDRRPSFRQK